MSSSSTDGDGSSSDERRQGEEVGIGGGGDSRDITNTFEIPSVVLKDFARGPFNPKKPLLCLVHPTDVKKKNSGGSRIYKCHVCEGEIRGSYRRVWSHFLGVKGKGVKYSKQLEEDAKLECYRLHMEAEYKSKGLPFVMPPPSDSQLSTHGIATHSMSSSVSDSVFTSVGTKKNEKGKRKASDSGWPGSVTNLFNTQAREMLDCSVADFFYAHAIPFHVARSPFFKKMIRDAGSVGPSAVPPGDHKLRTTLLDKAYSKVSLVMEDMRRTWMKTGCSIVMDGWTDIRHRPLINVIVTSAAGSYFLKAVDCSGKRKDADFQFGILREAIEEVGPSNVVQVITDSAHVCKLVGMKVEGAYKHIFWTPCCVHALNNALKDMGKLSWVKEVVTQEREIQMFICNHYTSLALFRTFSKKEFLKLVETRYASYFILLERMVEVHDALQQMVVNSEWNKWPTSNTIEGKAIKQRILDDAWWSTVRYVCSIISLVVDVIRYADTDSPSLGEIYETIDNMLQKMKQIILVHDNNLVLYEEYINPIFLRRWNTMNTPLHMAAYALNPKWYEPRLGRCAPSKDDEVRRGIMKALQKMYSSQESSILREQWVAFTNLDGPTFGTAEAKVDRAVMALKSPVGWWQWHGSDAPQLKMLAVRLLSQVASSSAAERNWSTYSFIHSVKRNRLTSKQAEKLVAVHSALRLEDHKTLVYRQNPTLRWDIDPEDATQVDEDDTLPGLVGIPLDDASLEAQDDSDSDFDMDD